MHSYIELMCTHMIFHSQAQHKKTKLLLSTCKFVTLAGHNNSQLMLTEVQLSMRQHKQDIVVFPLQHLVFVQGVQLENLIL